MFLFETALRQEVAPFPAHAPLFSKASCHDDYCPTMSASSSDYILQLRASSHDRGTFSVPRWTSLASEASALTYDILTFVSPEHQLGEHRSSLYLHAD
jgi:hypothetical protein